MQQLLQMHLLTWLACACNGYADLAGLDWQEHLQLNLRN